MRSVLCFVLLKSDIEKKKSRLKSVVDKLLSTTPSRQRLDVSYLLRGPTGKRPTRKPAYLQQFHETSRQSRDSDTTLPSTA